MFDGHHCTKRELDLLLDKTERIITLISNNNLKEINEYLSFIERFDFDIAQKMRKEIKDSNEDIEKIKTSITNNTNVLKQNVLVDIYEHNAK